MKRFLPIFIILFITCSYGASEEQEGEILEAMPESSGAITASTFEYIDTSEAIVAENFTDKKTIIIFWADYWGVCRRELPVFSVERINPLLYKVCPSDARLVLTVSPSKISVPTLKSAIFTHLG